MEFNDFKIGDKVKTNLGDIATIKEMRVSTKSLLLEDINDEMKTQWICYPENIVMTIDRKPTDNVNHPDHYTQGEIETIDVIEYLTRGLEGIDAVCMGNVIKYVMRCNYKNGWEDIEKAKWYLDKFME